MSAHSHDISVHNIDTVGVSSCASPAGGCGVALHAIGHAVSADVVCVHKLARAAAVCAASKSVESAVRRASGALSRRWAPAGCAGGVATVAILRVAVVAVAAEAGLASWAVVAVWSAGRAHSCNEVKSLIASASCSIPKRVVSTGTDADVAIHDEVGLALAGSSSPEGVGRACDADVVDKEEAILSALAS